MNIKRTLLALAASLLLPGIAMAGTTAFATFEVSFDFNDGNNVASTTAYISCNGGLPLNNSQTVMDNDVVTFVLEFPEAGAIGNTDCTVWVDDVPGYVTAYDGSIAAGNCSFTNVFDQDTLTCDIELRAEKSFLTVVKTWDVTGNSAEVNEGAVNLSATIKVCADSDIIRFGVQAQKNRWCISGPVFGPEDDSFSVTFNGANFAGNNVFIWEQNFDSAVEVDMTDCVSGATSEGNGRVGGLAYVVYNGNDDTCTVANTVFYEGIPTLNQYGLAIMALLMLGVGFVGFRRFV